MLKELFGNINIDVHFLLIFLLPVSLVTSHGCQGNKSYMIHSVLNGDTARRQGTNGQDRQHYRKTGGAKGTRNVTINEIPNIALSLGCIISMLDFQTV